MLIQPTTLLVSPKKGDFFSEITDTFTSFLHYFYTSLLTNTYLKSDNILRLKCPMVDRAIGKSPY